MKILTNKRYKELENGIHTSSLREIDYTDVFNFMKSDFLNKMKKIKRLFCIHNYEPLILANVSQFEKYGAKLDACDRYSHCICTRCYKKKIIKNPKIIIPHGQFERGKIKYKDKLN